MSEIKWIKIVTDIFDDEKILLIETLPEGDSILVIWLKLLCLAGKQNNSGVFVMQNGMPYTDKMLSIIFRRKETTVKMALETFCSFGMIKIIENAITIPNWGKHQNFDKIELKNEYMRKYMKDYRARQKMIAAPTQKEPLLDECKTNSKANVSLPDKSRLDEIRLEKKDFSAEFECFWGKYPKKQDKKKTKIKLDSILSKGNVSFDTIMNGLENYLNSKAVANGYTMLATRWLNEERWEDEPDPVAKQVLEKHITDQQEREERIRLETLQFLGYKA
jgi:predicted phage replisome organizer